MSSLSFSCISSKGTGFVRGVSEKSFPTVTLDLKAGIYIMGAWKYWIYIYIYIYIYIHTHKHTHTHTHTHTQRRMKSDLMLVNEVWAVERNDILK